MPEGILREGVLCVEGVLETDLPEGGFAEKTDPAQRDRFCRESPIRSGRAVWFLIEGWCNELQNSNMRRKTAVKRDGVGRGSSLYKADIANKQPVCF